MIKRIYKRLLAVVGVWGLVALIGGTAAAGSFIAYTMYGVRFIPSASIPANCTTGNVCEWVKSSDNQPYYRNVSGVDVAFLLAGNSQNCSHRQATSTPVTFAAGANGDCAVGVNVAGASVVNLPTPSAANNGLFAYVKDESGAAAANNITVQVTGGANIDGAATKVINTNSGGFIFYSSSAQWYVIGTATSSGGGGGSTLAASYLLGAVAADQTPLIQAGKGGAVIFKANGAATGSLLKVQTSTAVNIANFPDNAALTYQSQIASGGTAIAESHDTANDLVTGGGIIRYDFLNFGRAFTRVAGATGTAALGFKDPATGTAIGDFTTATTAVAGSSNPTVYLTAYAADGANNYAGIQTVSSITNPAARLWSVWNASTVTWNDNPWGGLKIAQGGAQSSGTPQSLVIGGPSHTGITASTEVNDVYYAPRTWQWATGALALERPFFVDRTTIAFVGASTVTTAAQFAVAGPPIAGTNATFTNAYPMLANNNGIATGTSPATAGGLSLQNTTAATGGVPQQYSPELELAGTHWNGASSDVQKYAIQTRPFSSTGMDGALVFAYSVAGGAYSNIMQIRPDVFAGGGPASMYSMAAGWAGFYNANGDGIAGQSSNVHFMVANAIATDCTSSRFSPSGTGALTLGSSTLLWNGLYNSGPLTCKRNAQSGTTYTTVATDCDVVPTNAAAVTVTLIAAASVVAGTRQHLIDGRNSAGANNISAARSGADTINGGTANVAVVTANSAHSTCESDGVSAWICGINN